MQGFWDGIDKLSLENLSQMTTENWIDASAYVAARATWAVGITKTAAVIRNFKNVGSAASGAAASFADKFVKTFDGVIGKNPAVITADGAVIVNASPLLVEETAQIIYSLNGMEGDKPKIIKNVDGVLDNEKKLTEVSQKLHNKLAELPDNGKNIKNLRNDKIINLDHILHEKHNFKVLEEMGMTQEEILLEIIDTIGKADKQHIFNKELMTRIWVNIKGQNVEIHLYLDKNGILNSLNAFMGYSNKILPLPIKM